MRERLTGIELTQLIQRVFPGSKEGDKITIICDIPLTSDEDTLLWRERREMVVEWLRALNEAGVFQCQLALYPSVGLNNADLPERARLWDNPSPYLASDLTQEPALDFGELFANTDFVLAPTQHSTTAPLKVAARQYGFRGATMPGFGAAMIPALRLDYTEIHRRCVALKKMLDDAHTAELVFDVKGTTYELKLDLRFRQAHASGGLFPDGGTAGNLPSGESYIVPYEGEKPGEASLSAGLLPVELDGEVVVYRIAANKAVEVTSDGPISERERALINNEPAYANLAELGLGVLSDFGIRPIGTVLLDEKLGLHIAFGRSDHFGGQVGPKDFSSPEAVVHIDRVYLDSLQPQVKLVSLHLLSAQGSQLLMQGDRYVVTL